MLQWKSNNTTYCECMCVTLVIQHCNAHVPYCHPWPALFNNIFSPYLKNAMILEKKLLNTKCVFSHPLQFLSETFLILRRIERDMIKNVYWSACKEHIILLIF